MAKLISAVEDREPEYPALIDEIYRHSGRAYRVGITGPPGAGKSTLVDQLVPLFRQEGRKVGILACDPTSPFSGGALLGDRIRMQRLRDDEEIFIRSLATRGSLGGLSSVAPEAALLLEAAGYDVILFETIGVGQAEIDIVHAADTVVVVVVPQSGDAIQALKAGLMEIADIFVVNKADQGEADRAVQALHIALRPEAWKGVITGREKKKSRLPSHQSSVWVPPIVKTVASTGEGLDKLKAALDRHREQLGEKGLGERRRARLRTFIQRAVEEGVHQELWDEQGQQWMEEQIERVLAGKSGPYGAAEALRQRLQRH